MELEDVSYQFLQEITDGFSDERVLGEGAFAVVYKGLTKNGDDVAVKKLKLRPDVNLDLKLFQNEFYNLTKLKHQNIVQILGYCYETEKKPFIIPDGSKVFVDELHIALCFEYLQNGSLQRHLSDDFYEPDWHTRFKIIKGICEGLKYIHDELEEPIYHLDLKPDNILLDKDMVPKIADFGLSRIFGNKLAWITRNPYGTLGYQPPEYIEKGEISGKFDIFSLGVVIIKIVSGPKGYPNCLDQVQRDWKNRLLATCTNDLFEAYCHQVDTCIQIALMCVETDSFRRPDIVTITKMLNEIEIDVGKLPVKGCHGTISRMIMHNSKKEMGTESTDITDQHQNIILRSDPSCNELELHDALETSSDIVEEHIVGRTEEKEKLIASLVEAMSEKIVILPIHGIGGIGKTTFARLIYNDPKFNFYSQVWVHVSQRFDLNKIYKSIILQLSGKESLANESTMIHSCLKRLLRGKKILIVLDDLWEDNQFLLQELKDMLYHDESSITILVTTRSEHVAERICTNLQPHKILPLTIDMCWDIIKQRSGFKDRNDKEHLMGIGREIAQKCGGVALAALSLGFTLRSMNFDEWMKVKDSDIWNEPVSKDLFLPNHVRASLTLSYSYMSPCLKQCFTYCATFPKGHNIVKDDLIYQWIAMDFIKPTKLLSNTELCERYIVQLLGLSFFQQPVSPKTSEAYYKQATFFTMHDLVHDLAISLLGNQIIDQGKQGNTRGSNCQYALLRDCSRPLELYLTSHARLRALRFLEGCKSKLSGAAFAPSMSLRVLDLSECSIQRLPDSIGQLKQLRYLNAPEIQDKIVLQCITELSNLIYLDLHGSSISALPKSIGKLKKLMHLNLSNCRGIHLLPVSFKNLEKLAHLDLSNCSCITGVSESLLRLSRLEHLNLSQYGNIGDLRRANLSRYGNIGDMRTAMSGLTGLQYLNLSYVTSCVGLQEVLGNLTKLRYLNLQGSLENGPFQTELDELLECVSRLSSLEYLNLSAHFYLFTIPESIGNLRKLNTLDLSHCSNLQSLPASLSAINSLKFLHVTGCLKLDKSTLPQNKSISALLPHFVVHVGDGESRSNLSEIQDKHLTLLDISRLENVKSAEEAKRIKLAEKQSIEKLGLAWTRDATRFADDKEVLSELVPPDKIVTLTLQGYSSISCPPWMMSIATYLPRLTDVTLRDLPSCNVLPPLGQLPNLERLKIDGMDSIRKIDGAFYGGRRTFPQLREFDISRMECLEEWNAEDALNELAVSKKKERKNELAFPKLQQLSINRCPLLRIKGCLPDWATARIHVYEDPLHQWSLLDHLPCLKNLRITDCSDLGCCSTDLVPCNPSMYLPRLEYVTLRDLPSCNVLPPLGQLPNLKYLDIAGMDSIRKIDGAFYGGRNAFPRLEKFDISRMECLEEWNAEDGLNELAFAELWRLSINHCPLLRFKACSPPGKIVHIDSSDQVLLSSWENRGHVSASSSTATAWLHVKCCEVPLHQWSLLRHLPCLKHLIITDCSDLTYGSTDLLQCISSLEDLTVKDCKNGIVALQERMADDREVLSELVAPDTIETLTLNGYNSISSPSWMMSIATYLPRLTDLTLRDLPSCNVLPPLGQLPNLEWLKIDGMDNIRKIDGAFYGGRNAFPRLEKFDISRTECLEEWNAEDALNELAFPKLQQLTINRCPLLRFKGCSPPGMHVIIDSSDQILLSSWENRGHVSASSSTATASLHVKCCEVPLHQWSLLRHLPCLKNLRITDCSDLTCGSTDLLQCISSLEDLTVKDCKNGIVALQERMADDREVLSELVAPDTIETLTLNGYNSISSPSWMMSIATYLPRLKYVTLGDLPSCNVLPPLGQLPNLLRLKIDGMGSIRKIDGGFYGGRRAFPRLEYFSLSHMDCLEEWNAEDGLNELAFPELWRLSINRCPLLRFKACWPRATHVTIDSSDQILLSSWENRGHVSASSMATKVLEVSCCEVPLHQWSLLRHLPCLRSLYITDCSDPGLVQWCKSEENKMKLAHIKDIIIDYKRFRVTWPEPKLKNKGAPTRKMENLENTTRDAIDIDTGHPTQLLSRESGSSKENYDESKYEREASKQQREVLKLSRDFESLTVKDEAGHDASALEDLPAQQFSLGSSIGSTTTPGTSRTQRRRKPAAVLIRRKGGTARPCRGTLQATPQTLPDAGPSTAVTGVFGFSPAAHLTSRPPSTTPFVISLQCPALPPTSPGSLYTFTATTRPHLPLPSTARTKDENEAADERQFSRGLTGSESDHCCLKRKREMS